MKQPYNKKKVLDVVKEKTEWTSSVYKYHRQDIADYLYGINDGKCFYCKGCVDRSSNFEAIEHITSKTKYPQFTYHPRNLTLTCSKCNTFKLAKNVFNPDKNYTAYKYDDYPNNSDDFIIVHPYIDSYYEHISIDDGIFFKAINGSSKGNNTIDICHLDRIIIVEEKIRRQLASVGLAKRLRETTDRSEMIRIMDEIENVLHGKVNVKLDNFISNRILCDFVDKICHDDAFVNFDFNNKVSSLNKASVEIIKYFKFICSQISSNDKRIIRNFINIDNSVKDYFSKNIVYINFCLDLIYFVIKKDDFREMLEFIVDIDYSKIMQKYFDLGIKVNENIQTKLLFNLSPFIELCKLYKLDKIEDELGIDKIWARKINALTA